MSVRAAAALTLVLWNFLPAARPASARSNPSINWSLSYSPVEDPSDAMGQQIAGKFDLMEVGAGDGWAQYVRKYNPNFVFLRYDNFTNGNYGGEKDKYLYLQSACAAAGQDFERMWVHYSQDTKAAMGGSPIDDRFRSVDVASGSSYNDMSYWAYAPDYGADVAFARTLSEYIALGHFNKFSTIRIAFLTTASSDLAPAYEYVRSDSTWQPLSITADSTVGLTQNGSIHFTPPSDWGFTTIDGMRRYWVRIRGTHVPTRAPHASALHKEHLYTEVGGSYWLVPGWDPANDTNGDGWVSDAEYTAPGHNANASARMKYQARITTFYWYPERYVFNVGDPLFRQLNAKWAHYICALPLPGNQLLSGMFEDNCVPMDGSTWADSLHVGNHSLQSGGDILEYPGPGPGRRFQQDHLKNDSTTYVQLMADGKWFEGNSSQYYTDNHIAQYDPQSVHTITMGDSGGYFAYSVHTAVQRETWAIPKTMVTQSGNEAPVVSAIAQFRLAREATANGRKCEFLIRQSSDNASYGPAGITRERDRMFGLTYFCMVANANAYCGWMPVGGGTPPESTQWWPAVGYDFGQPQNDSVYTFQTGTDTNGEPYVVYARYFTKALVLVKPKAYWNSPWTELTSPVTPINLPTSLRKLNYDGTLGAPITQIALKNIEGAILVGSVSAPGGGGPPPPPPPPGDTIPPAAVTTLDARYTVVGVSPEDQGLATTRSGIKVDLSEDVDPASLTTSIVVATGSVSGVHPGTLNVVKRYLTFTPLTPFTAGERITVRLLGTLKSTSGRFLDGDANGVPGGDKVWTFTVGTY